MKQKTLWIIVVLAAVAVVAYFVWTYLGRGGAPLPALPDAKTRALGEQGTSDDVSALEQDLSATDLSGLDKELQDLDQEFGL